MRGRAGRSAPALRRFYSAFKSPVASLNSVDQLIQVPGLPVDRVQVFSVSYHRALSSSTVLPCCSTQV